MGKFKIIYDRQACIGANACVVLNPQLFEMDKDGKANLIGGKKLADGTFELVTDARESIIESARGCPVEVIKVIDLETGKKIV
ncbi:TPA: ferredoxin [Candidatus Woesearchaeota archaeon]|nr:ferredoxin [Candidatus Woesearchaeota archaeon]